MRRVLLAGGLSLAALMGLGTSASAQERPGQPGGTAIPQTQHEVRDITNQDILDKEELDTTAEKRARKGKGNDAVPATLADIVAGSQLHDKAGVPIGTVDRLDPDGVVVATAKGRVKVPLEAFGKNGKGLLLALTKAEFDQMIAGVAGTPAG
jgi:hypothetical protein